MVKNTQGGSSHKKFGRKFATGTTSKITRLRVSEDEGEIYAIATKMLGNNMFHCFCIDGLTRLCHIRGKFTGRGKRDNIVSGGKWILIGLREWDTATDKKGKEKLQQCDLLEIYSDTDKYRLKESISQNWSILDKNDVSRDTKQELLEEADGFTFGTEKDFERERLIEEMKSATAEKITLKAVEEETADEEVYFDDI
jgi:translation initiation factor 1A